MNSSTPAATVTVPSNVTWITTSTLPDAHGRGWPTRWDHQIDSLQCEIGNFRVALDWAAETSERTDAGLRLAVLLIDLWRSGANHAEGLSRLAGLLGAGGSAGVRSDAARRAAYLAYCLGDSERTFALRELALQEAVAAADQRRELRARRALASTAGERGDMPAAHQHLERAIQISIDEADEKLRAECLLDLAELEYVTAALDDAAARIHEVLKGSVGSVPFIEHDA